MIQARTVAGMMELLPEDQIIFNQVKEIIENTYRKHGFLPLDTPAIESMEVLLAKGGGETQKQIYSLDTSKKDRGLRFDLTVPLAKYVALYFNDLHFPFRRYHIGKVYRGERNQRGRYREFYQADIDIIGHNHLSTFNDAEIIATMGEVFERLKLDFLFRYNNRKLLNGFFNSLGIKDFTKILQILDQLAKVGEEKVVEELKEEALSEKQIESLLTFISIKGSNEEIIEELKGMSLVEDLFKEGLEELESILEMCLQLGLSQERIQIDLSITRGLDYYTGMIIETFIVGHEDLGSVCSGGRYDDLAGNFTSQKLPGTGASIGLTRLFYVLQEKGLLSIDRDMPYDVLIVPMKGTENHSIQILNQLRNQGIHAIIHMEKGKMGKKFAYADQLNIPYVIVIGEDEVATGLYSLRNMETGEQEALSLDKIIEVL